MVQWHRLFAGLSVGNASAPARRRRCHAAASGGIVAGPVRDRPRIDFDDPGQGVALRLSHGAAELGTEQPGRLNRIEPELRHQLLRRISVGMGGNQIRRAQPGADRELGAVASTVSAVIEVWRPQGAHSGVNRLLATFDPLLRPPTGRRNTSGQRAATRYASHALSSGN